MDVSIFHFGRVNTLIKDIDLEASRNPPEKFDFKDFKVKFYFLGSKMSPPQKKKKKSQD